MKLSTPFLLLFILSVPGFAGEEPIQAPVNSITFSVTGSSKQYVNGVKITNEGVSSNYIIFRDEPKKILEINNDGTIVWYKNGGTKPTIITTEKELTQALFEFITKHKEFCK